MFVVLIASHASAQDIPVFRWQNFTTADGLPDNHVYCVLVDDNRIWAGTDNGIGRYENGKWTIFRPNPDAKEHSLAIKLSFRSPSTKTQVMSGWAQWVA